MQVQCLPVHKAETPRWMYRKVPKVTSFTDYGNIPTWCRKPQPLVYRLCAEDITKSTLVPLVPPTEKKMLLKDGVLPFESSAKKSIVSCALSGMGHRS